MTYKELYLKEHPDLNSDQLQDALDAFCPGDYFQNAPNVGKPGCVDRCYECWNKELLEEKTEGFKAEDLVPVGEEVAKGFEKGILEPKTSVNFDGAEFQKKVYEAFGIPEFKSLTHEEILEYRNTLYEELLKKQGDLFKDVAEKRMELDKEDLEEIDNDILKEIDNDILKEMIKSDEKEPSIKDSGTRREFSTGAVRDIQEGKGRMDLLPWSAIMEVSKHCERGAKKYGERNVDKGIPTSSLCDSAARHLAKYLEGWTDEPHLLAAAWNLLWAIQMEIKNPEVVNTPWRGKANEND